MALAEEDKTVSPKEPLPKWKRFEQFVASIQAQMTPNAQVKWNDTIVGKSGVDRQIDVSVRYSLGQFNILAVIDCKDYKRPVDIADVGCFADLVEDVRANKGALICNAGFTEGAEKRAGEKGIDLLQAVNTDSIEWPAKLSIPVLCRCSYLKSLEFQFRCSLPIFFVIPKCEKWDLEIYRKDKSFNNILINLLYRAWNEGKLPVEVGKHEHLRFLQEDAYTKVKDKYYGPVEITVTIVVENKLFFGHLPVQKSQGFANGTTGAFVTKSLEFGIDFLEEIETKWRHIKTEDELAVQPSVVFGTADCYHLIKYVPKTIE